MPPSSSDEKFVAQSGLVYIVDDDTGVRGALARLLRSAGYFVSAFEAASDFLEQELVDGPACLLLDLKLPKSNGLEVQEALSKRQRSLPVIFISGFGSIPVTVRAMRAGAVEFLTKPCSDSDLLCAVNGALAMDAAALDRRRDMEGYRQRYESLTPREREVMRMVIGGLQNKQLAGHLGTSEITAKVHKRHVMEKMRAPSVADLVRIAERLGIARSHSR